MTRPVIERRIALLERQILFSDRQMHLIKATDRADSERQIVELVATGKVGPRDGFLTLTGRMPIRCNNQF